MPIGKLDIALTLDAAGVTKGVRDAQRQIGVLGQAMAQALGRMGTDAIYAFGRAIGEAFSSGLENMEAFNNAAARLGQGIPGGTQLKALSEGLIDLGADAGAAQTTVESFTETISNMLSGKLRGGAKTLKALGVEVVDTAGRVRPVADIFQDVVTKINTLPSAAQRATAASKIFGAETKEMLAIFASAPGAVSEATSANEQLAAQWQEFASNVETIGDALQNFFASELPAAILPFINDMVRWFQEAWPKVQAVVTAAINSMRPSFDNLLGAFGTIIDGINDVVASFGGWGEVAATFAGSAAAIMEAIAQIIEWFRNLIEAAMAAGRIVANAFTGIDMLKQGNFEAASMFLSQIPGDAEKAVDSLNKVLNTAPAEAAVVGAFRTTHDAVKGAIDDATALGQANADSANMTNLAWGGTIPLLNSTGDAIEGLGDFWNGGGSDSATKKMKEYQKGVESLAETINNGVEPQRVYNEEMAKFDEAVRQNLTSEANRAVAMDLAAKKARAAAEAIGAAATPMQQFADGLLQWGNTVASSFADAIVEGEDLGDVFQDLIKQLIKMAIELLVLKPLMNAVLGPIAGSLGGGGMPFLAPAAPVAAAMRGLPPGGFGGRNFSTGSAGGRNITMGAMTINFNGGRGGQVQATDGQAAAFGGRIRDAIQQEIVRQSRPGGLLWAGGR